MSSNKHLKRHIKRTSDQVYEMQVGRKKAAAIYGDTTGRRQRFNNGASGTADGGQPPPLPATAPPRSRNTQNASAPTSTSGATAKPRRNGRGKGTSRRRLAIVQRLPNF